MGLVPVDVVDDFGLIGSGIEDDVLDEFRICQCRVTRMEARMGRGR